MATTRLGFPRYSDDIASGIFIPKYYDPAIRKCLPKTGVNTYSDIDG